MDSLPPSIPQQEKLLTLFAHMFAASGKTNIITSPLSVYSCLAMIAEGASGQSFKELSSVLGYEKEGQVYSADMLKGLTALHQKDNKSVDIRICNLLYASKQFPLKPQYVQAVVSKHWATAENVDFSDPSVKDQINNRISKETNGLIKNPISQLDANTQAVLVNTIYFKGTWEKQFEKDATRKNGFTKKGGEEVQVDFMNAKLKSGYFETTVSRYLSLAYKGGQIKFVIEMPKDRNLAQLDDASIIHTAQKPEEKVFVSLPRFKFESKCDDLLDILQSLGVKEVIKGNGLQAISDGPIGLTKVIHQAFIQVDEEGTEAAAATVAIMTRMAFIEMEPPKEFKANSPFFFHLVDSVNKVILFTGAVQEPKFN